MQPLQIDGGPKFKDDFEKACQAAKILLYGRLSRKPQRNGGVERSHSTCRHEFYASDLLPATLRERRPWSDGGNRFTAPSDIETQNTCRVSSCGR